MSWLEAGALLATFVCGLLWVHLNARAKRAALQKQIDKLRFNAEESQVQVRQNKSTARHNEAAAQMNNDRALYNLRKEVFEWLELLMYPE